MASWTSFHLDESQKEYFKSLEKKLDHLYSDDLAFFGGTHPPIFLFRNFIVFII